MSETTINVETFLPWSQPRRVETKHGPRMLAKASPTEEFWKMWRNGGKAQLAGAGVSVGQDKTGRWEVCWWRPLPAEDARKEAAMVEASRASDLDVTIPAPSGLSYLGYQKAGIAFARKVFSGGKAGVLIGDEMGLGKTIQAIGLINDTPQIQRVLVICPNTLKLNWYRELKKWLTREMTIGIAYSHTFPSTDIVIINYDVLHKYTDSKLAFYWDLVICDEAHLIKNPKSRRSQAVYGKKPTTKEIAKGDKAKSGIPTRRKLALTGTPILNRVVEAFPILNWLDPETWNNFFAFAKRYCDAKNNGWGWDFSGASHLDELQTKLRSTIMVRRLKADVLTELPPKRRQVVEIPVEGSAAKLVRDENEHMERHIDRIAQLKAAVVLSQASDNPDDYKAAVEALGEGMKADFEEGARIAHDIAIAKIPYTVEHVREILESDDKIKVIVFAHHLDAIEALRKEFDTVKITGEVEITDRDAAVQKFQTDPECRVIACGIKAAGVGITLTKATVVVFHELDWVPGNMSQCEDRAHRIGQRDSVLVQHMVLSGSLDVHKSQTLIEKQEVIDRALDDPIVMKQANEPVVPIACVKVTIKDVIDEAPLIDKDQRAAILQALQSIAGICNGARTIDGMGFSKVDVCIGKSLASQCVLSQKQAVIGKRLVSKYRRQLSDALVKRCGVV